MHVETLIKTVVNNMISNILNIVKNIFLSTEEHTVFIPTHVFKNICSQRKLSS